MSCVETLIIAPSVLSADFGQLAAQAREVTEAGAEYLHCDVMDGVFVPNISFGMPIVRSLKKSLPDAFLDVHLMIVEPDRYLEAFAEAGADGITVQVEACTHLQRALAQIRGLGKRAGVALNPSTPPDFLEYVLDEVDLVLVMTVNPGFGGQAFLSRMVSKIERVREIIAAAAHPIHLEVDGGIDVHTARRVVKAGATALVAGTSVFGHSAGIGAGVRALREAAVCGD